MVFAMAVDMACGGSDAQTGDLGTETERCASEYHGVQVGDGESRRYFGL